MSCCTAAQQVIASHRARPIITLEWIGRAESLVIADPDVRHSDTGKSHFTEGLTQAAIGKDMRVSWFTLETLSTAISKSAPPRRSTGSSTLPTSVAPLRPPPVTRTASPRPSTGREWSPRTALPPQEHHWPHAGVSDGHQPGDPAATHPGISMAVDTPRPEAPSRPSARRSKRGSVRASRRAWLGIEVATGRSCAHPDAAGPFP